MASSTAPRDHSSTAPLGLPTELSGRFPITDVSPSVLGGRRPAAAAVGELVPVTATCFREGHDSLGVEVVLTRPDGTVAAVTRMHSTGTGLDGWAAQVDWERLREQGRQQGWLVGSEEVFLGDKIGQVGAA